MVGLYFRSWVGRFNPDKEDFKLTPIWIRLSSIPHEYQEACTLEGLSNTLGSFVKVSKVIIACYTYYAHIRIFQRSYQRLSVLHTKTHNGSNRLTMSTSHSNDGGCTLNALATKVKHPQEIDVEDFTKVTHRRR